MCLITDGGYPSPACTAATNQARGTVCTASCDSGYYPGTGQADIICDNTGEWDTSDYLTCVPGCPSLPPVSG